MNVITVRSAMFVSLFASMIAGPVMAQQQPAGQPSSGLGSAWPSDAQDVSHNPGFRAYMWVKSGVKYIQINDSAGHVLAALATANGIFLPLPMGREAQHLQTPSDTDAPVQTSDSNSGATVYQDDTVEITATPQSNGSVQLKALSICTDPVECSTHLSAN